MAKVRGGSVGKFQVEIVPDDNGSKLSSGEVQMVKKECRQSVTYRHCNVGRSLKT